MSSFRGFDCVSGGSSAVLVGFTDFLLCFRFGGRSEDFVAVGSLSFRGRFLDPNSIAGRSILGVDRRFCRQLHRNDVVAARMAAAFTTSTTSAAAAAITTTAIVAVAI